MHTRPVWAEVSLDRLIHNYHLLRSLAADAELIAVVKANAYGHGVLTCAQALHAEGAKWLGVTCLEEAIGVRAVCPAARILVMSGVWGTQEAESAVAHGLTPVVWDAAHIAWLQQAASQHTEPSAPLVVHLEIDTGMARQGVQLEHLAALLDRFDASPALLLEGVMTHFHSPENLDEGATAAQMERFERAVEMIAEKGFRPQILHAGNSATVLTRDGAAKLLALAGRYGAKAMVRPGLSLYGYAPRFSGDGALSEAVDALLPVLSWKTRVVSLRTVEAGASAGYNATFHAQRASRLALLPVGYADGLNRLLSNRGDVLVRGQRAPIAGRISMDLTIVDVTDVDGVELGDEVVLVGEQKSRGQGLAIRDQGSGRRDQITAYDLADLAGTIPYEVLCGISARVPRVVVDTGDAHV